jgi:hypothetical protein
MEDGIPSMSSRLLSLAALLAASLSAQAPMQRCSAPTLLPPLQSIDTTDCDYFQTNPTANYAPTGLLRIPVVVHVIQNTAGQGAISDAQVRSQIAVLNEDYRARAGTLGANGVDTRIEFFLSPQTPLGAASSGIVRHTNDAWFNDQGDYWTANAWDTTRFLNIYTNTAQAFGAGALGYTVMPQSTSWINTPQDRVVIHYSAFGRPGAPGPYALGRVCTHEIGHYLGLFHTYDFGCDVGNCHASGDRICDTNPEAVAHFDCVTPATSCGVPAPLANYMSAADDACLTGFSQEQARRMRCTLLSYRPQLAQSVTPSAAAVARTGPGNRNSAYTISPPRLGQACVAQLSTFNSGFSLGTVVGYSSAAALPYSGQTILLDPTSFFVLQMPLGISPYVIGWSFPVPNDLALAGVSFASQGVLFGADVGLTNAMDVVIGN